MVERLQIKDKNDDSELAARPPTFSLKYMERGANPNHDIYTYSCGTWLRDNPVPPTKSTWHAYWELMEWNRSCLRKISEKCSSESSDTDDKYKKLVGNFYSSAMDTDRINRLKFSPVQDLLDSVSGLKGLGQVKELLPKLHAVGVGSLFNPEFDADEKDSRSYTIYFCQGGLSLPDREYYLSGGFAQLREDFRNHMQRIFVMSGLSKEESLENANHVLEIETEIAKASRPAADLRDAEKNYNSVEVKTADAEYPTIGIRHYLEAIGSPKVEYIVVSQPEFLASIESMLKTYDIRQWKAYLSWHVLHAYASMVHKEVRDENFDFFARKLLGNQVQEPEWKRAVAMIDSMIGEALGKLYVDEYFSEPVKRDAAELVKDIVSAFRERLQKVPWMSEETRKKAVNKLDSINVKLGSPDRFRDYSGLVIKQDDYVGNIRRSSEFEFLRLARRTGKKVDRTEWGMTPPTVNAYYDSTKNEICIPAGIMQPCFFDTGMDDAVNYGAIGQIIGHELTHGFDDQGRKFDAEGNMHPWWKEEDESAFKVREKAVVKEYGSQEALPGMFINGQLTLGENIADLGGLLIAYYALQDHLAKNPSKRKDIDGFTPEQRFFISYAQSRRENMRAPALKERLITDPHSPQKYRVLIPCADCPGFDKAFPPKLGEPQHKHIGVW